MKITKKTELINELLEEIVKKLKIRDNVFYSDNYSLSDAIIKNTKFRAIAGKIINEILDDRQAGGISRSKFDDKLYKRLLDGETIIWSDITGVVPEKEYDKKIKQLETAEEMIGAKLKTKLITTILSDLTIDSKIVGGRVFVNDTAKTLLLPKIIKDLKFYETEDIYDYMGIEILDTMIDFFICISNDGAILKSDTHNKNYVGTLVDSENVDLVGNIKINIGN